MYQPPKNYKGKNKLAPLRAKTIRDYYASPRAKMTNPAEIMTIRTSSDWCRWQVADMAHILTWRPC
jgi:hypothetical protein